MTHQIELHDADVEITITFADGPVAYSSKPVQDLDEVIRTWFGEASIGEMKFEPDPNVSTTSLLGFTDTGGTREYSETLDFAVDDPRDPVVFVTSNDPFQLSDYALLRPLRNILIRVHNDLHVSHVTATRLT